MRSVTDGRVMVVAVACLRIMEIVSGVSSAGGVAIGVRAVIKSTDSVALRVVRFTHLLTTRH